MIRPFVCIVAIRALAFSAPHIDVQDPSPRPAPVREVRKFDVDQRVLVEKLKNATYKIKFREEQKISIIKLKDGYFRHPLEDPSWPSYDAANDQLDLDSVAFGGIGRGSSFDAAVIIQHSVGGGNLPPDCYLCLIRIVKGNAVNIANVEIPFYANPSMWIDQDLINIKGYLPASDSQPGDPWTREETQSFKFSKGRLINQIDNDKKSQILDDYYRSLGGECTGDAVIALNPNAVLIMDKLKNERNKARRQKEELLKKIDDLDLLNDEYFRSSIESKIKEVHQQATLLYLKYSGNLPLDQLISFTVMVKFETELSNLIKPIHRSQKKTP